MKTYYFKIVISGTGEDADEAWNDAVESLSLDPGATPGEDEYSVEDIEDEEEEEL